MTFDDFTRLILTTWPDAVIEENQLGELVIFTGHRFDGNNVVRMPDEKPH